MTTGSAPMPEEIYTSGMAEPSWCRYKSDPRDVRYIRADLAPPPVQDAGERERIAQRLKDVSYVVKCLIEFLYEKAAASEADDDGENEKPVIITVHEAFHILNVFSFIQNNEKTLLSILSSLTILPDIKAVREALEQPRSNMVAITNLGSDSARPLAKSAWAGIDEALAILNRMDGGENG